MSASRDSVNTTAANLLSELTNSTFPHNGSEKKVSSATATLSGVLEFKQKIIDQTEDNFLTGMGDIDGDGKNDIIGVGPADDYGDDCTRFISWYHYPDLTKRTLISFTGYSDYTYFGSGDFRLQDLDRDGDLDIISAIAAHPKFPRDSTVMLVWWENPRPASPVTIVWKRHDVGIMGHPKDIVANKDMDNDGKLDIVTRSEEFLNIFFQNSADSWSRKNFSIRQYEGMAVGDLDGDGDPDIAVNGVWYETPKNPRTETFTEYRYAKKWLPENQPPEWRWARGGCKVRIVDLDKDGKQDIVVSPAEAMKKKYPVAWYYTSDPKGGDWTECVIESNIMRAHSLQVADFNLDGKLDVLCGAMKREDNPDKGLWIYLQGSTPLQWNRQTIQLLGSYCAVIGDIDGDGDIDVVNVRDCSHAQPTELWENQLLNIKKTEN